MPLSVDQLVQCFKALGDPTRLRLVALLAAGERTVKDLTDILAQSQPRISRHLRLLADAGLVERSREGAWVYYRLDSDNAQIAIIEAALSACQDDDADLRRDRERLVDVKRRNREAADTYFAAHAAEWDRIRALHVPESDVEAAMLAAAGPGPFRALLDVGTGTGRMLELFADRYHRALGIDRSQPMLALARANLERAGIAHARVRSGDILSLAVPQSAFDLVVIHQVLHFLDEPSTAVGEAARALAPGGRLIIADFAPHDLEFLRTEHAHRRFGFTGEQVGSWMQGAGLSDIAVCNLAPDGNRSHGLTVTIWSALSGVEKVRAGGARSSRGGMR